MYSTAPPPFSLSHTTRGKGEGKLSSSFLPPHTRKLVDASKVRSTDLGRKEGRHDLIYAAVGDMNRKEEEDGEVIRIGGGGEGKQRRGGRGSN